MNSTTKIVLEYLSPGLATEMMARIHALLPQDPQERTEHLNEVHRELRKAQGVHDQVTPDDFQAPEGQYRLMREEMSDGKLSIIADYTHIEFARRGLEAARETHPDDVFTLCDDKGPLKD
jgi:hypothetical protein